MSRTRRGGVVLCLFLAAGSLCRAQTQPLYTLVSTPNSSDTYLYAVNDSGDTAVGRSLVLPTLTSRAVRWDRALGPVLVSNTSGVTYALGWDVSDNSVITGESVVNSTSRVFRTGPGLLQMVDIGTGVHPRVSDDGTVISFIKQFSGAPSRAYRWTSQTGAEELPGIPAGCVQSLDISGSGNVIVGFSQADCLGPEQDRGFRWENGVFQELILAPGATGAVATRSNADGSVIVGYQRYGLFNSAVCVWRIDDQGGQTVQVIGAPPGRPFAYETGISGDGAVVLVEARAENESRTQAYLWTQEGGWRNLTELMISLGADLGGRTLLAAHGANFDGSVIVGISGGDLFNNRGFVIDFRRDTDGDGLLDHWELSGIPYLNDLGKVRRIHLPGADPTHKDLYVEIDAMSGFGIDPAAVAMVVQAFSEAPLDNPDGTTGVRLHVLVDENDLPLIPVWQTDGCWPPDYNTYYDARFGTAADRAANGGGGFLFRSARAKAYRYCLIADRALPDIGGCAGIPGDKSVLFFGGVTEPVDHATVFMHELGHNLGLGHGGHDSINGKPNYPSIMNYVLAYRYPWNEDFWRLDYSREGGLIMGHLNESSLDETRGIGSPSSAYADFLMPIGINDASGRAISFVSLDGWQQDYGDTMGTGIPDGNFTTGVIQDLNYLPSPPPGISLPTSASPGEMLQAHNDWASIVLATPEAIGPGAPAPVYPTDELTITAKNWIAENFPFPGGPAPCYANCDNSTQAPVLNVADFSCFLTKFAGQDPYANCDGSTIQPVLNVADFSCFLSKFAAGCP